MPKMRDANDRFFDSDKLKEVFQSAGVNFDKTAVIMCRTGMAASVGFIAAQGLFPHVKLYDGSWSEYSVRSAQ
jgi:3-mercaptopyruvate sulfurtransferase SseA